MSREFSAAGYVTGTGQHLTQIHPEYRCVTSRWCVIHRPMPGPWSDWPTHWRSDWGGFMERICPCGVGHPVAEDSPRHNWWHGCCGIHRCVPTLAELQRYDIDGEIVVRELEA